MATLNTLRTRGALFLSIFIGVALIAFLLQDLTSANSVLQRRRNRVGTINGNSIDYVEFAAAADNLEENVKSMYGRPSLTAAETDQVRDMLWDSYIRRYSYEPGYKKLGLAVEEAEKIDMVQGRYVSPVIASMFGTDASGGANREMLAGFVASLESDATGRMPAMWDYAKGEMTSERALSKYVALASAGVMVNDLEVARSLRASGGSYNGRFAMLPFSGIADSTVTVPSSEVRSYYNAHKNRYRQGASRDVEYVAFEITPSETDYADAAAHIATLSEEFAAAEEPAQYAAVNSQEPADPRYRTEAELTGDELAIAFGERRGEMAGPTLTGNVYTMSRVADDRVMPDSVGARHILLPAVRKASADSLVAAIKGGADIFALAPAYTMDQTVDLGRFRPEMMVEPFANAVIAAGVGDVFAVDTQFGTHVVQVTYKGRPVRKVRLATIVYNVEPSDATDQAAYAKARDFLAAAAGSKEKFDAAVTSTGANIRVATINGGDRDVNGLADSRELVRWSFNTKPGTVSTILEIDDNYIVAVLTGAKEAGIADVRDVAQNIAQTLRNEKKAATLTAQMTGKSVDEVAAMTGARTGEFTALRPTGFYDTNIGMEPAVFGAVEAVGAGATSKPVVGYGGVYLLSVASIDKNEEATDASERVRLEAMGESSLPQRLMQALTEGTEIEDYRSRFF